MWVWWRMWERHLAHSHASRTTTSSVESGVVGMGKGERDARHRPLPFVLVYTNGEGAMHVIALPFLHPCGPAVDVSHCLASPNTNGGGAMSSITLPFLHRAIALPFPHHIFI